MTALEFGIARPDDDGALRALLRRTPMPGEVTLASLREPSFFAAARVGNLESQTMVCRDTGTGAVVGMGERAIRAAYLDGDAREIGYLANLRGAPEFRGGLALARGYRYLRSLHRDGRVPFYVTTILEENAEAIALLTGGRAGLPTYEQVGRLVTYLLPVHRRRRSRSATSAARPVEPEGLAAAHHCLDAWNRRHQLAPVYSLDDLAGRTPLLPSLSTGDLYVLPDRGGVAGTLAVWDQSSLKQAVVASYSRRLALARPLVNAFAPLRGVPGLPRAGGEVRLLYGALLSAAGDAPESVEALLERVLADSSGRGASYLVLGLAEGHPLGAAVARRAARTLVSRVYAVYWAEDGIPAFDRSRPLHLEVATL